MDINPGEIIYFHFTTRSGSPPVPITFAGSPAIQIYKDDNTTQSTSGVTLTVDHDAVTGHHVLKIDTSADSSFYAAGKQFFAVVSAGTVGGTSVVGEVIFDFSIQKESALRPTTASRTLNVSASGVVDSTLVATGLDAISVADPGAPSSMTTLAKMLVAIWRSIFCKKTLTSTQGKFYDDAGTGVNATSAVSDDGTTQTWGKMS
jgi:hypothetical protein